MHKGGVKIEQPQNTKLLGINIYSDLNFSNHISDLCKRTSQQIRVLTRLRNLIPASAKLQKQPITEVSTRPLQSSMTRRKTI